MSTLQIKHLGPIHDADIQLGDLSVFVGPQATGKSLCLQTFKLLNDIPDIKRTLKQYGFEWYQDPYKFQELYFGEGLDQVWNSNTQVTWNNTQYTPEQLLNTESKRQESVFLIPAQRVLILANGWPRNFSDYGQLDPYVLKRFSENIRQYMEKGLGSAEGVIFPQSGRFKKELRDALVHEMFRHANLLLDTDNPRKRMVLSLNGSKLPFMSWSAGQKEFTPLMLGLYWLIPPAKASKKNTVEWVILEEPEMGLHPRALTTVMLFVLELLSRGYKVILSTHSPQLLDMVWTIREIQTMQGTSEDLLRLFNISTTSGPLKQMADTVLSKNYKTWFFEPQQEGTVVKDISALDPGAEDDNLRTWGELTDFPSRAGEVVSQLYQRQYSGLG